VRTPIIAGNWKLNNTIKESLALVKAIHYGLTLPMKVDIIVAPPFTALNAVAEFLKDSFIDVAAQNCFWEDSGAYTGEISAPLLKEAGANWVIVGHSERRQYFGETNQTIQKKVAALLKSQLKPILCVGETLEEREQNLVETVIKTQLKESLANINSIEQLVIAYEPVWAIGTGKTATPEQAEEVHQLIREILSEQFSASAAEQLRILYGGSMKSSNCAALMAQPNIDGGLIGGASLKAEEFIQIINTAAI